MNIERIYIQDNFVPDPVQDQFRRKVIGIGVFIKEGESLEEAEAVCEQYIKEYIQRNTIYPDHKHIEESIIPDIKPQKTSMQTYIEEIMNCKTLEELKDFNFMSNAYPELKETYNNKLKTLTNE